MGFYYEATDERVEYDIDLERSMLTTDEALVVFTSELKDAEWVNGTLLFGSTLYINNVTTNIVCDFATR